MLIIIVSSCFAVLSNQIAFVNSHDFIAFNQSFIKRCDIDTKYIILGLG